MNRLALKEAEGVRGDLAAIARSIEKGGQPDAAVRLLLGYEARVLQFCSRPGLGRIPLYVNVSTGGLRFAALPSPFGKFQLFFLHDETVLRVIAVLHGSLGTRRRSETLRRRI